MPDANDATLDTLANPAARTPLRGDQAAAILMLLFAEEQAAEILARLEPDEVRQLSEIMYSVANVGSEDINEVLDLFIDKAKNRTTVGYKADEQIEGMLKRALGDRRAETMLTRVAPKKTGNGLDALKWMDAVEIALLIEHEHPQIAAVVLSYLKPDVAANVLQLLAADAQEDIVFRLATLGPVSAEALETIEALLASQGGGTRSAGSSSSGGTSDAAAIMNIINKRESARIIRALTKRDKDIARRIEDEMFTFADLIRLDPKDLGALVRSIEADILVPALKGADDKLRDKMFACMSSRAAQSIADDIAERGPMPMSEVLDAQKAIVQAAKRMADAGEIVIGGGGDEYV
ncbi:flagellar motor switch protein FliG [Blastomonas sp.]|uniref:flagellar motor switch protein FliG n=1 Tax=Blastomonas sp. TaxID=1909299 RepID=UPI0035932BED